MNFHKPRFQLSHLVVLIAMAAVILGAVPVTISPYLTGLTLFSAALASTIDRVKWFEWAFLACALAFILGSWMPAMQTNCRRKPMPATTTVLPSGKV